MIINTGRVRWGVLGTGGIARRFAADLALVPDASLVAVGSRSQATADALADMFGIRHRHPTYADLAADPEVDVIYVATPHTFHAENALLCLDAGKGVLVEKPFTINAHQAQTVVDRARRQELFLMEAMWTRYLPSMVRLRRLLADGVIGEVRMMSADFGFRSAVNPTSRLYDPGLGGGALLDVGVYPVSFASMLFGAPNRIQSLANLGETGVDEQAAILLGYPAGQMALLATAIRFTTPQEALILGTEGRIRLHAPWWKATRMTITRDGHDDEVIDCPLTGHGFHYEAAEVTRCLLEGRLESATMPLDESVSIMGALDQLRAQWGLRYPNEFRP